MKLVQSSEQFALDIAVSRSKQSVSRTARIDLVSTLWLLSAGDMFVTIGNWVPSQAADQSRRSDRLQLGIGGEDFQVFAILNKFQV